MNLKDIKNASLAELHKAAGIALASQGQWPEYSKMLANRITAIKKEIAQRGLEEEEPEAEGESESMPTPGPWTLGTMDGDICIGTEKGAICQVPARYPHGADAEANARLMAAAPEMLEALRDLLNVDHKAVDIMSRIQSEGKALDAIRKATGA